MPLFQLVLDDFNIIKAQKASKKTQYKQISKFYENLAKAIVKRHNQGVKIAKSLVQEYPKPYLKLVKNSVHIENRKKEVKDVDDTIDALVDAFTPPYIKVDLHMFMDKDDEKMAVKTFKREFKNDLDGVISFKELRTLYYSSEIANFVNTLKSVLHKNLIWKDYMKKFELDINYKPQTRVGVTTVLSLR